MSLKELYFVHVDNGKLKEERNVWAFVLLPEVFFNTRIKSQIMIVSLGY